MIESFFKVRKKQIFIIFFTFIILHYFFNILPICQVRAQPYTKLDKIVIVDNEDELIEQLIKGMKNHKSYYQFYYSGIIHDFKQYKKSKPSYCNFIDQLSKKDGYLVGILSGYSITIVDDCEMQYVCIQLHYLTSKRQEKKIQKKVEAIVKKIGKGSKEKRIRFAHDYLIKNIQYDAKVFNPYTALFYGKGNCMTYSLLFQRILQEMKIPCIYIKGSNHAWNMVQIGKYWYNVDVTWDDTKGGYYYFLKSDHDFPFHKRPKSRWLKHLKKHKFCFLKFDI